MKLLYIVAYLVSIPARLLGMKLGNNVVLGPGYPIFQKQYRGITLEDNVIIGRNSYLHAYEKGEIRIKSGTNIGKEVTISSNKNIVIGKNCLFGYRVSVIDHEHITNDKKYGPAKSGLTKGEKIIIGDECFVGSQSFILKGVRLGKRSVVGANSVVTKSFPAYSVLAGSPAKKIK